MKLIKDKKLLKNIASHIDLLNTVGGGICQTNVNLERRKKGAILKVSAPSVSAEAFQIVLNQNKLTVMATLRSEYNQNLHAPLFHQEFVLPPHINLDRVKAVYEGQELHVHLPYFENQSRQIDIELE